MNILSVEEARNGFTEVLNRAKYNNERTIVTRRGKEVGAIISMEDLRLLEVCVEALEDRADAELAHKRLASLDESGTIPLEEIASRLGL
jgi:prevent-host-death family protein